MKVQFEQNESIKHPQFEVHVLSDEESPEITNAIEDIKNLDMHRQLLYIKDNQRKNIVTVSQRSIVCIEVQVDLVTVITKNAKYVERTRLYKVKDQLSKNYFSQISKSAIINLFLIDYVAIESDATTVAILMNEQRLVMTRNLFRSFNRQLKEFAHER